MKRSTFRVYCATTVLVLILSISTSSCQVLPDWVQRDLQRQFDQLLQQVYESARNWVSKQIQHLTQEATQKVNEYFGWTAPEKCGFVDASLQTLTPHTDIQSIFQEKYKHTGGGRVIGWPHENVDLYQDNEGRWLFQYLYGGSSVRSLIIMEDGSSSAYLVPGEWLVTYENAGGMKNAGKPISDIQNYEGDFWKLWGKDQIQKFIIAGETYALMKPGDVSQVMVVPPLFWNYYEQNKGKTALGAALSSFPLDEDQAIAGLTSGSPFHDLIMDWRNQPERIQVFEKGSIIYDRDTGAYILVKAESLSGGETNLAYSVGPVLLGQKYNLSDNQCFYETIPQGGTLATVKGVGDLMVRIAFIPAEAAVSVGGWTAETLGGKLIYELTGLVLAGMRNENILYAASKSITSSVVDSLYGKIIGDTLSEPMADASISVAEGAYNNLQKNRLSFTLKSTDETIKITMNYDPWTHYAWGIITSGCQPQGFLYKVELDPKGVVIDESLRFYDLANGGIEIH